MRPTNRIYKYLSLYFDNLHKTDLKDDEQKVILYNKKTIFEYWKNYPDQRLTQMVFNIFGFKQYYGSLYHKECKDYLNEDLHIPLRDLLLWGSYGKDQEGPLKHIWLDDIESDHIQAILDTQKQINTKYKKVFIQELQDRGYTKNDPKFGQTIGEVMLVDDIFVTDHDYFQEIDIDFIMAEFEDLGIPIYADYKEDDFGNHIYYEITDEVERNSLIKLPSESAFITYAIIPGITTIRGINNLRNAANAIPFCDSLRLLAANVR